MADPHETNAWVIKQIKDIPGITSDSDPFPARPLESFVAPEEDAGRKRAFSETREMLKRYEWYFNKAASAWAALEIPPIGIRREGNTFKFPLQHRDGSIRRTSMAIQPDTRTGALCLSWGVDDNTVQFNKRGLVSNVRIRPKTLDELPGEIKEGVQAYLPKEDTFLGIRLNMERARTMGIIVDMRRSVGGDKSETYGTSTRVDAQGTLRGFSTPFLDLAKAAVDYAVGIDVPLLPNAAK